MRRRRPKDVRAWLEQQPSLADLSEAFPIEWEIVRRELGDVIAHGDGERFRKYVASLTAAKRPTQRGDEAQLSAEIRQHLALAAVRRMCVSAATGITNGRVRFNLLNGWIAQKLLFEKDLVRKPASAFWFRLLWPLLWQRKFLMILVQPKGIYCFYSRELVDELVELIDGRPTLEIAAGDGTLSRFLTAKDVSITATDDHSWNKTVQFPDDVQKQDARTALQAHQPEVVICSWPPAGNSFEREVFKTPSVQLYIVISSRHEFGSGNWNDYRSQTDFELTTEPKLARLVLPPEIEPAVYVFRRKSLA
jgi:hypothetical protein